MLDGEIRECFASILAYWPSTTIGCCSITGTTRHCKSVVYGDGELDDFRVSWSLIIGFSDFIWFTVSFIMGTVGSRSSIGVVLELHSAAFSALSVP